MQTEVSCLCGDVILGLEGEPIAQLYCHCKDCQKVHGGAYACIVTYPHEKIRILSGHTVRWTYKTNARTRYAKCGTLLFAEPSDAPFKGVEATLLPAGFFKPSLHMQCQDALVPVSDALPHYRGFPPEFGGTAETVDW